MVASNWLRHRWERPSALESTPRIVEIWTVTDYIDILSGLAAESLAMFLTVCK